MRESAFAAFGPGEFVDVAIGGGRGYLSALFGDPRDPSTARFRVISWPGDQPAQWRQELEIRMDSGSGYGRLHFWQGQVWAFYHDGIAGYLWNLSKSSAAAFARLSPCEGSSPGCFGHGLFAYQGAQSDGRPVVVVSLFDGLTSTSPNSGAPTGLSRIDKQGIVWTVDQDRLAMPGATQPCFLDGDQGSLEVGEAPDGGALWRLNSKQGVLWPGTFTGTPRCAGDGALVAICTGGGPGIRVFCGTRDELVATAAAPIEPPKEEPKKPADPPAEKPKESPTVGKPVDGITDAQFDSLKRLRDQLPEFVTPEQGGKLLNDWTYLHRTEGLGMQADDTEPRAIYKGRGLWAGVRGRNAKGEYFGQDVFTAASVGRFTPQRSQAIEIVAGDPAFIAPEAPEGSGSGGGEQPPVEKPPAEKPPAAVDPAVAKILADSLEVQRAQLAETKAGNAKLDALLEEFKGARAEFAGARADLKANLPAILAALGGGGVLGGLGGLLGGSKPGKKK
jgi:hypothetical protein